MNYGDYLHLTFERKPRGVLLITINRPEAYNATNARLHWELTQVWLTVDADPETRVAVITGAGKAFSAGGDLELVEEMAGNAEAVARTMREASDLVYNLIGCEKPVVSAINGVAVGAGLVVSLQNTLATSDFPVTIATGLIFMICVLIFRRGIVGEVYARIMQRGPRDK